MIAISFDIHPLGLLLVPSMFTFFLLLFYRSMLSPTIIREKERERERGGGGREMERGGREEIQVVKGVKEVKKKNKGRES